MRDHARALGVVLSLCALAPAREARAQGAVVGAQDSSLSIASSRVAVATSPGRTTRWIQIQPSASGAFAWILPVAPGARVDVASDAWLDALDLATAPVIVPPELPPGCDVNTAPEVTAPTVASSTQSHVQAVVALDMSSLQALFMNSAFPLPAALSTQLEATLGAGSALLVLVYANASLQPVHTIRVVDSGPATLPFALTGGSVDVTAFSVTSSPATLVSTALSLPSSAIVWSAAGGSNYDVELASLFSGAAGGWFSQSSSPTVLLSPTVIEAGLSEPSVVGAYYQLASKYGDTAADPGLCEAAAVHAPEESGDFVGACPAGTLAVVPGSGPCAGGSVGTVPIDPLVCGPIAVDAALSVAGLPTNSLWVSRWKGLVTPAVAADIPVAGGGSPSDVIVPASRVDPSCPVDGGSPDSGSVLPSGGGGGGGSFSGSGGGSSGSSQDLASAAGTAADVASAAADTCSSSTDSGGCGGDSSEGGGSGGCSSDEGSSDAGSCSGGSGNNDCSTGRRARHGRSPLSRAVLVTASLLFVLRRRRRSATSRTADQT